MKQVFFILLLFTATLTQAQDSTKYDASCSRFIKSYPVLWQQTAAEYRALCYQAFNMARLRVDEIPKRKLRREKLAIITDLDETIIDNSYSEAQLMKEGKEYNNASWKSWTDMSAATAVPGAVEFLQHAKQKGIAIFYISNRDTSDVASTVINLQKHQAVEAFAG